MSDIVNELRQRADRLVQVGADAMNGDHPDRHGRCAAESRTVTVAVLRELVAVHRVWDSDYLSELADEIEKGGTS